MKFEAVAFTHIGRRETNEDSCCVLPAIGLFAVADGMGGYEGGEVASRLAIETISEFVWRNATDSDVTWPYPIDRRFGPVENEVAIAARLADERIATERRGRLRQMGSTVAMLRVHDRHAVIGHVGDSRVYRLRRGQLEQLTVDHSFHAMLAASGAHDLLPRHLHPQGNIILRALGTDSADADVRVEALEIGDVFLLCTDGLSEMVPQERMVHVLGARPLAAAAEELVAEAYVRGGRDNITLVVVRVVDGDYCAASSSASSSLGPAARAPSGGAKRP